MGGPGGLGSKATIYLSGLPLNRAILAFVVEAMFHIAAVRQGL